MELECLVPKNTENRPTMGSGDRWRNSQRVSVLEGTLRKAGCHDCR